MGRLHIIVPIKQVPDMEKVKFDKEEGKVDRESAKGEINPFDRNALEEGVRLKEEIGGEVTVISMGPPQVESSLKDALARGGDRAILISGEEFAAADTWATSFTLSEAIRKVGEFDVIICGEKTVDGDTGQVGPEIAEILGIPHAAYVHEVLERSPSGLRVASEVWGGTFPKELRFPGLITVTKDVNDPRLPTFKDRMKARKADIEIWDMKVFEDIGGPELFGLEGSHTMVRKVEVPPERERKGEIIRDEPSKAAEKVFNKLEERRILEVSHE